MASHRKMEYMSRITQSRYYTVDLLWYAGLHAGAASFVSMHLHVDMQYSCIADFTNHTIIASRHAMCDAPMTALLANCKHRCREKQRNKCGEHNEAYYSVRQHRLWEKAQSIWSKLHGRSDPSTREPGAVHVHCRTSYFSFQPLILKD